MADFQTAVLITLQHEGGYVNNPADPGGATNMGIEQRDIPTIPISALTREQAMAYYLVHFWPSWYSSIASQAFTNKLFDMGVLFGLKDVVMLLQRLLNLPMDGVFGANTLNAVNAGGETLLFQFKSEMSQHIQRVIAAHPTDIVFETGWQNRVNS